MRETGQWNCEQKPIKNKKVMNDEVAINQTQIDNSVTYLARIPPICPVLNISWMNIYHIFTLLQISFYTTSVWNKCISSLVTKNMKVYDIFHSVANLCFTNDNFKNS